MTKTSLSKELYAIKKFDIIMFLWSKLLICTLHNKNRAQDEKVFASNKNQYHLYFNRKNIFFDLFSNNIDFYWTKFLIALYN